MLPAVKMCDHRDMAVRTTRIDETTAGDVAARPVTRAGGRVTEIGDDRAGRVSG